MQDTNIPSKFPVPFGNGAGGSYIRTVPNTPSGVPGAASLQQGFPPENFNPVAAGGVPPFGQDFNGLLNQISAWNQWQQAGGAVPYDGSFQTAIGGYPNGAIVESAVQVGAFWMSTVDNNVSNPDTGGANWLPINYGNQPIQLALDTGAVNTLQVANTIPILSAAQKPGFMQAVIIGTSNTAAATLQVDSGTALPIVSASGISVGKGQLPLGGLGLFIRDFSNQFRIVAQIPIPGASTTLAPKLVGFVSSTTGQTVPSGAGTTLSWGTVIQNNMYGTSTWNGTTLTVGSGEGGLWGFFFLSGYAPSSNMGASYMSGFILKNGTAILANDSVPGAVAGDAHNCMVSGFIKLAAGDTVTFQGFQQSGSTQTTASGQAQGFLISAY